MREHENKIRCGGVKMKEEEMREVYATTLIEMGEKDRNIVVLEADLMAANGTKLFQDKFPDRIYNILPPLNCLFRGLSMFAKN